MAQSHNQVAYYLLHKILFDECVPESLLSYFAEHEVYTVSQMGWMGLKNGALLTIAENDFDVFLTLDKNLPYQQNLSKFQIGIVLVRVRWSKLRYLIPVIPRIKQALVSVRTGQILIVEGEDSD